MSNIQETLLAYTAGEKTTEAVNEILKGSGLTFTPGKNALTEEEIRTTTIGTYPDMANGWGLLDTGTPPMNKVFIQDGKLDHTVNEVLEDGSVNSTVNLYIAGRLYSVKGDTLAEYEEPDTKPVEKKRFGPDTRKRPEYAGQTVRVGKYDITYNDKGYAVKSVLAE
ncbi:hypothetical protein [Dysosmobacter sp.]|jgi:hypothetical protein|uniref:hypothetical protein n=1 Tax=Dysosmobacter sp. TaxID=2591382 RepID=UPI00205DE988|nr:MAG TPA: hypothetical protein [Caudoviricetes sp.]